MEHATGHLAQFLLAGMVAIAASTASARADDYSSCVEAGQRYDAAVSRLRTVMKISSGCEGEPGFEASSQADKAYYRTPRGQACREARQICNNLKPEVGLHHCGRFLKSGQGYPDQVALVRRINAALDNAYGECPAQ